MTSLAAATAGLFAVVALLSLVWIVSVRRRDAGIIDIWWGPGFAMLAWLYCALLGGFSLRPLLLASLITLWGARLAWHIATRNPHGGEDPRYAAMRARHGTAFWWRSLFFVFWLQAVLLWGIALPILAAASDGGRTPAGRADLAGLLMFALGFGIEAIGDQQLRRFKANPANRGKVLDSGLWHYTRHPNYFGDALLWWGVYVMAAATPGGRLTIASPALMTLLLLRVSGVTLLEQNLRSSKPDYAAYVSRTSAFIPWFRCSGHGTFPAAGASHPPAPRARNPQLTQDLRVPCRCRRCVVRRWWRRSGRPARPQRRGKDDDRLHNRRVRDAGRR